MFIGKGVRHSWRRGTVEWFNLKDRKVLVRFEDIDQVELLVIAAIEESPESNESSTSGGDEGYCAACDPYLIERSNGDCGICRNRDCHKFWLSQDSYVKREKLKQMDSDDPEWGQQRLETMRRRRIERQAKDSKDRAEDKRQGSDEPYMVMEPKYVVPILDLGEQVGSLCPCVAATDPARVVERVTVRDSGGGGAAEAPSADSVGDAAAA